MSHNNKKVKKEVKKEVRKEGKKKNSGVGTTIYEGSASFGRVYAILSAIVVTIIGLMILSLGIYVIIQANKYKKVIGKVLEESTCLTTNTTEQEKTVCTTKVEWKFKGETITSVIKTSTSFSKDQSIPVYYLKSDYKQVTDSVTPVWLGSTLIAISVAIVTGSWIWVWLTQRYTFAAATEGVGAGLGIIKRII